MCQATQRRRRRRGWESFSVYGNAVMRRSLTGCACASRVEGQHRRPYPLHLREGCGSHELERPRQSMRRGQRRPVDASETRTLAKYSNAKRAILSLSSSLRAMRMGFLVCVPSTS